jgi:CheY-like chemotaxis protein/HPt (histidine-containing phosphotransfer) domain-containing protein
MVKDPSDPTNAPESASPFDLLEARLAGLKAKMVRGLPDRVRELEGALTQLRARDPSAREALKRFSHKLRGVAGTYGFQTLTERAAEGEHAAREGSDEALVAAIEALLQAIHVAIQAAPPSESTSPPITATPLEATPPNVPAPAASTSPLLGLNVLAADDDDATRRLLEITLRQVAKCEASLFDRGHGLLAALEARDAVDLVIVDAMMPEMNGLEFLEAVVASGQGKKARLFVVLSAATAEELGWKLPTELRLGWLRKPFRPRELVAQLEALMLEALTLQRP